MNSLLLFLLKSTLCLSTLYLAFSVLMRHETYFKLNRMLLLLMVLSSAIIPFLTSPQAIQPFKQVRLEPIFRSKEILHEPIQPNDVQTAIQLSAPASKTIRPVTIPIKIILGYIYLTGALISILLLLYSIVSVLLLFRKARKSTLNGFRLRVVTDDIPAFSFGRTILISQHDYDLHSEAIIIHEQSHIRLGHIYDLMLMEMVKIIFWFNPLVYSMIRDLKEIHEFQADDYTLHTGIDATQYQLLIIQKCVGYQKFALANSFNHCQIKNRITMMNKQKTSKAGIWKVATFLPLLALLLMAFGKMGENLPLESHANQVILNQEKTNAKDTTTQTKEKVYAIVEVMPEFPGGEMALRKYLSENVQYPKEATAKGIQGKVFVNFIVNSEGKILDAKVIRGVSPSLDAEGLRVIRAMPNWKPGKEKGVAVSVRYTLPIRFLIPPGPSDKTKKGIASQAKEKVYTKVEIMPEYPGGEKALRKFLSDTVQYPKEAIAKRIEGKVFVNFIVNREGEIVDAKVLRGVSPSLDAEGLRVIRLMPNWKPGKEKGVPVSVSFTIPINFVTQ